MIIYHPEFCKPLDPGDATTNPDGTPIEFGRWVANYPLQEGAGAPFHAQVHEGVVEIIEVRNDILSTAEGVSIGSSLDELTAAYPSLAPGEEASISKSLLLATPEGDMVFEVAIDSDYGGYLPNTVIDIRIYPPGRHDLKLVAASDDVVGGCL